MTIPMFVFLVIAVASAGFGLGVAACGTIAKVPRAGKPKLMCDIALCINLLCVGILIILT